MLFLNRTIVAEILKDAPEIVRPAVVQAYRSLADGESLSAQSTFLPIPNEAPSRFITLPAYVAGEDRSGVAGTKWVSNFRGNVGRSLMPINTLLLLSDIDTGTPLACIEGSQLNLRRTAASAYLAAECFGFSPHDGTLGFVGAGALAQAFCAELIQTYAGAHSVLVSDVIHERAESLAASLRDLGVDASTSSTERVLGESTISVLGTSAEEPWIDLDLLPTDHRLILNISADDIPAEYFTGALNVTDRIRDTATLPVSLGRAIQQGLDVSDVLELPHLIGTDPISDPRPVVFSPFGLSVLDVALAHRIHEIAASRGLGVSWDHRG